MATLEALRRQHTSTETLLSVVKNMKALASVRIGQYRRALKSILEYSHTLDLALRVVLATRPELLPVTGGDAQGRLGAVVFGSDQGLCGPFNDHLIRFAGGQLESLTVGSERPHLITVGRRARARLRAAGLPADRSFPLPGSPDTIVRTVQEVLLELERWVDEIGIGEIYLFYNRPVSDASYRQKSVKILPLDSAWLSEIQARPWPSKVLPTFSLGAEELLSGLVRHVLFIGLFRAVISSQASENAARLAAMRAAESNIEKRLDELQRRYQQQRQIAITEELLEIQAGFEALTS